MSVVKTLGTGAAWNTTAVVVGKILIFANVFLILTFLSVYEYGFSELTMSIISTVGAFLLPGLTAAVVADMSVDRGRENIDGMKSAFLQYIYLNSFLGVVAWALLFFGSAPVARIFGNPYAAQFLQIASFVYLISPFRQASQVLAATMLRYFDQSFYGVIEEAFKCVLLLILVVWMRLGLHGLMYSIVGSQALVALVFLPRTLSAYRSFAHAHAPHGLRFWNIVRAHRKWSVGTSYIGTLAQNARLWIIKFMLGTEVVGLFAFAYGIFSHVASLMPLTTALTPLIPRYVDKRDQLVRILRASVKVQFLVGLSFAVVALATSRVFVMVFFPHFAEALPILYVVILAVIPNGIVSLFTPVFAAFKEQRSLLFSNIVKVLLTLILLPPAILLFGPIGTAVELVMTSVVNGFERYLRLRKTLPEFTLRFQQLFHPDKYEKEAMQTIIRAALSRAPRILASKFRV